MLARSSVALVDPDPHRRALICSSCARLGLHVEPYESPSELAGRSPAISLLIHDSGEWFDGVVEEFAQRGMACEIIAFSEAPRAEIVAARIFGGALDYLAWPFAPEDLVASLERVSERAAPVLESRERSAHAESRLRALSPREREVVVRMADGMTNKVIGQQLQISPRTVEIHRANALGKLGVDSSAAAIRLALEASRRTN